MFFLEIEVKVFIAEICLEFISSIGRICILKVDVLSLLVNLIVSANTTQKNFLIFRLCSLRIALYIFDNSTWIFLVNHLSILIKDISMTSELSRLIVLITLFSASISSSF